MNDWSCVDNASDGRAKKIDDARTKTSSLPPQHTKKNIRWFLSPLPPDYEDFTERDFVFSFDVSMDTARGEGLSQFMQQLSSPSEFWNLTPSLNNSRLTPSTQQQQRLRTSCYTRNKRYQKSSFFTAAVKPKWSHERETRDGRNLKGWEGGTVRLSLQVHLQREKERSRCRTYSKFFKGIKRDSRQS